jgi:hypothetical protein
MNTSVYVPPCEAERRLGLSYINIAAHGNKSHLGKYLDNHRAIVLFSKGSETIACLWDIASFRSITSKTLPFSLGMLWDWDWRAEAVQKAFTELSNPSLPPDIFRATP